ncbi:hypothetical protein AAHE18_11G075200 [Arachis hypogaea]
MEVRRVAATTLHSGIGASCRPFLCFTPFCPVFLARTKTNPPKIETKSRRKIMMRTKLKSEMKKEIFPKLKRRFLDKPNTLTKIETEPTRKRLVGTNFNSETKKKTQQN